MEPRNSKTSHEEGQDSKSQRLNHLSKKKREEH